MNIFNGKIIFKNKKDLKRFILEVINEIDKNIYSEIDKKMIIKKVKIY